MNEDEGATRRHEQGQLPVSWLKTSGSCCRLFRRVKYLHETTRRCSCRPLAPTSVRRLDVHWIWRCVTVSSTQRGVLTLRCATRVLCPRRMTDEPHAVRPSAHGPPLRAVGNLSKRLMLVRRKKTCSGPGASQSPGPCHSGTIPGFVTWDHRKWLCRVTLPHLGRAGASPKRAPRIGLRQGPPSRLAV